MRILVSTFAGEDAEKLILAMRSLPYEQIVLIGADGIESSSGFRKISMLEEMAGHELLVEIVDEDDFMELVDAVSAVLVKHSRDPKSGSRSSIILNISGGSKLLGDAALFAAFRLGIETYHCDERITRLPVIKGATARDRFTPMQVGFLAALTDAMMPFDRIIDSMKPASKSAVERLMRELRKSGLIKTDVREGRINISLSDMGAEVSRALTLSRTG